MRIGVEIYDKGKGKIMLKIPNVVDYVIGPDTARRLGADLLKVMRKNNIIQSPDNHATQELGSEDEPSEGSGYGLSEGR